MIMWNAILLLALCVTAGLANAGCPSDDWKPFGDKCYLRSTFSIEGVSVDDVCNFGFPGARAVSIHDLETNTFLAQELMQGSSAWIGLQRQEGEGDFSWTDGSPLDWTYWYREPEGTDQLCGSINYNHNTGQWGSLDCAIRDPFICELNASEESVSAMEK